MKLVLGKGQRRNRRRALSHAHDRKRRVRARVLEMVVDTVLTLILGHAFLDRLRSGIEKTPKSETETK